MHIWPRDIWPMHIWPIHIWPMHIWPIHIRPNIGQQTFGQHILGQHIFSHRTFGWLKTRSTHSTIELTSHSSCCACRPGTNVFTAVIYEFFKSARVFVNGKPFQLSLVFTSKARALLEWNTFQGLYTKSIPLDLPANIRLGWKSLPGTNTISHYEDPWIIAVKCFTTLAPEVVWPCGFQPKHSEGVR